VDFHGRVFGESAINANRLVLRSILPGIPAPPTHSAPFLSIKNTACETAAGGCIQETTAYYNAIGATSGKETLAKFRTVNGFDQGDTSAIYYNAADLGFGREMHCRQSADANPDVACYVTNYGLPAGDPVLALSQ